MSQTRLKLVSLACASVYRLFKCLLYRAMAEPPLVQLWTLLAAVSQRGAGEKFFAYAFRMFLVRYAEAAYFDAAVWARRTREAYCLYLLKKFDVSLGDGFWGLSDLIWMLPDWVWQYTAGDHMRAYSSEHGRLASGLGLGGQRVWRYGIYEDLTVLREYGNSGAHASYYMAGARMEPDAEVVLCAIRIAGSFVAWGDRMSRL